MAERIYGHCRACHMTCPAYYEVEDGKILSMEAVPSSEGGTDILCGRGKATLQLEYSPTRVRYPLKRAGKRGEGKWERISWDQAIDEIAHKVYDMPQEYGPETFVLPGRTGRQDMGWIAHRIARTIGTPNNYYGAIQQCLLPQMHTQVTFGNQLGQPMGMDPNTKLFLSVGTDLNAAEPLLAMFQTMAQQTGYKQITLDPVYGPHASHADEWLPIRPGTDLAYFMCLIRDLLESATYDYAFCAEWTNAPFLINVDTGDPVTEADVVKGGSASRYLFWDEATDAAMWWDRDEIQWQGGESGRAHYDMLVENFNNDVINHELSPARMPEGVQPAMFGTREIESEALGMTLRCKPAMEFLWESVRDMTPERCAQITGVPQEQIERTCKMVEEIRPIAVYEGLQYQATNAGQFYNSANVLKALTGSVDVPGAATFTQFYPVTPQPFPGEFDISYADGLPLQQKRKRLGYYDKRIGCGPYWEEWVKTQPLRPENADATMNYPDAKAVIEAAETGRPYEVHGLFAISSNWLMHDPCTARWMKLLEDESKIQLHVVTDMVMTPTAEMADYVLPAQTWMERNYLEFKALGGAPFKNAYRRAVEPIGEARHDYDFGAALAHKLEEIDPAYNNDQLLNPPEARHWGGVRGKLWENDTIDEERDRWCREFFDVSFEEVLENRKLDYDPKSAGQNIQQYCIAGRFTTKTGKAEIYSMAYHDNGYPATPTYAEPAESPLSRPDLAKDYPLVFTTGKRQVGFFHSEFRQIPYARELNAIPEVFINPVTAARYGVDEGDWIWVESSPENGRAPYNRIMGRVSYRYMCRPDLVSYSQHAWWRPEKAADDDMHGALEWNVEGLLEFDNESPDVGTMGLRSQLCRIYKATPEEVEELHPMITRDELEALMPLSREEM